MTRGELTVWIAFALSAAGLAVPDLAGGGQMDAAAGRWLALPLFAMAALALAGTHLFGGARRAASGRIGRPA